jgi:CRISPR-associated exonuclease Cas4
MIPAIALLAVVAGAVVLAASAHALAGRRRARRLGTLVAADAGGGGVTLRSERYRISGRPDLLRRTPDGRTIPIELKRRAAPARGPYPSHEVQLWAYCLLVEETTGVPPPYGVLRYADREYRVPWDASARRALLAVHDAWSRPYRGEATPSPARCGRCPWAPVCDARVG